MRRVLGMVAALALAACQVEVEGAQCDVLGATDQCPDGQACGIGYRCSKSACRLPATAAGLYVDVGASRDASKVPTGIDSPPECRFASIPEALAVATDGTTVHVAGSATQYGGLPLTIRKGISLVAETPTILANTSTEGAGVVLEEGSRLEGFTVRATGAGAHPLAIQVSCGATDNVTLARVRVDAAASATHDAGIELLGPCEVDLTDVEVVGATGVGLSVNRDDVGTVTQMTRGRLEGCGTGASLTRGDLRLVGTSVVDNLGTGVYAGDGGIDTRFAAVDALFAGNADTALVAYLNDRLDLLDNRICQNGAVTLRGGGAVARPVGGIFLRGPPPSLGNLVFSGNEIHHNAADQVFVAATTNTWTLDGGTDVSACASTRNLFFGYDATTGRGLVSADADVNARWNGWEGITPASPGVGRDYEEFGSASIDVGTSSDAFCNPVPAARSCP